MWSKLRQEKIILVGHSKPPSNRRGENACPQPRTVPSGGPSRSAPPQVRRRLPAAAVGAESCSFLRSIQERLVSAPAKCFCLAGGFAPPSSPPLERRPCSTYSRPPFSSRHAVPRLAVRRRRRVPRGAPGERRSWIGWHTMDPRVLRSKADPRAVSVPIGAGTRGRIGR